eukprot:Skav222756  [mRNA]  locus=scaffold600:83773:84535:+ [translate_table: standard]
MREKVTIGKHMEAKSRQRQADTDAGRRGQRFAEQQWAEGPEPLEEHYMDAMRGLKDSMPEHALDVPPWSIGP